jgi:hypothetical protein
MHVRNLLCRAAVAAVVLGGVTLAGTAVAGASQVDPADFNCGTSPIPVACNQTAHYNTPDPLGGIQYGGQSPNATNCGSYVAYDVPAVTGTGQGIEHAVETVNGPNGGFWFTSTFTGTVTVQYWTVDPVTGFPDAPDPAVPIFTGHITETGGFQGNNRNFVTEGTVNFTGTAADGTPATFHALDHTNTNAVPPPDTTVNDFHIASC